MPLRAILFDFDGVLVESNEIKSLAFHDLYLGHGTEAASSALDIHVRHHGASRFEKFAIMHREILGREITAAESAALGEQFAEICFERVCACPAVAGARDVLELWAARIRLSIVSATPQDELRAIVKARGLTPFFRHILGKPGSKLDNINQILRQDRLAPGDALFDGDQISDNEAAHRAGLPFIARAAGPAAEAFRELPGCAAIVPDLTDFSLQLDRLDTAAARP